MSDIELSALHRGFRKDCTSVLPKSGSNVCRDFSLLHKVPIPHKCALFLWGALSWSNYVSRGSRKGSVKVREGGERCLSVKS